MKHALSILLGFAFAVTSFAAEWKPFSPQALEDAARAGKPVLIDFTATWCVPCKEMERKVFPDTRLVPLLDPFALLRADMTDSDDEKVKALAQQYQAETLPTVVILDEKGQRKFWATGFQSVEMLMPALRAALPTKTPTGPAMNLAPTSIGAHPVRWRAEVRPTEARRGESAVVTLTAEMEKGWHIYALPWTQKQPAPTPTTVIFSELNGLQFQGKQQQTPPKKKYDEGFALDVLYFEGQAEFSQKFFIPPNTPVGTVKVTVTVRSQACDAEKCLNPRDDELTAEIRVVEGEVRKEFISDEPVVTSMRVGQPVPQPIGELDAAVAQGFFGFVLFAMGAGFLSLITPCVFPMIPITVSFFTKQSESEHTRPVGMATAYCAGIIAMFTVLGMALALILGPAGPSFLAANPWVNLLVAAIFIIFALNLFGAFEIQMPAGVTNFFNRKSAGTGGYVAAVLMGVTFSLAAFTCTVPFAGIVLAGATRGQWFWPIIGMIVYATAFASPFFFLALFPRWMASLPKSGGWLNATKVVMGFLELAAAFKFVSNSDLVWEWNLFTPSVVLSAWAGLTLLSGLYLLDVFRLPQDTKVASIGISRLLVSFVSLALALYLASGLFGQKLHPWIQAWLPYRALEERLTWEHDIEKAKAQSLAENKPIFIDFTGYTCTNCRLMEVKVFPRPEIEDLLKRYVRLRLYTDDEKVGKTNTEYQLKLMKFQSLPYYVAMDADESIFSHTGGLRTPEEFRTMLQAGLDGFGRRTAAR